ncbi:hypothetical protein HY624_01760 [Candidatus Uhrbacteria bacterium]|nr:hypothetical protein [Candidatus Uhrbacteria bacterium]
MDIQQKSHWEQGLALTLGLLLLASLTAYVGASTTPSSLFAEEDDDALIEKDDNDNDERRRQEETRNFLNDLSNVKQEFKNNNAVRDLKQQTKNLQRVLKQAGKLAEPKKTEFTDRANKVMNELTTLQQQIQTQRTQTESQLKQYLSMTKKGANDFLAKLDANDIQSAREEMNDAMQDYRDATQDFYSENYWDVVSEIQRAIEGLTRIPKELKNMKKEFTRLETYAKKSWVQKIGIDLTQLNANIEKMRTMLNAVQGALEKSDFDSAQEALQDIYEWANPGDIRASLDQLREVSDRMRTAPKKLRTVIEDGVNSLIESIRSSVNEGDFRDANRALQELRERLFNKYWRSWEQFRGDEEAFDDKYGAIFQKLESTIEETLEGKDEKAAQPQPATEPTGAVPEKKE